MEDTLPQLLQMGDVAKMLGLSYWGVREIVEAGRLEPITRTLGGTRLFHPAAVEKLKQLRDEQRRAATARP